MNLLLIVSVEVTVPVLVNIIWAAYSAFRDSKALLVAFWLRISNAHASVRIGLELLWGRSEIHSVMYLTVSAVINWGFAGKSPFFISTAFHFGVYKIVSLGQ